MGTKTLEVGIFGSEFRNPRIFPGFGQKRSTSLQTFRVRETEVSARPKALVELKLFDHIFSVKVRLALDRKGFLDELHKLSKLNGTANLIDGQNKFSAK